MQRLRMLFESVFGESIEKIKHSKNSEDKRDILSNCYDELQGLLSMKAGVSENADQMTELKKINLSVTRTNSQLFKFAYQIERLTAKLMPTRETILESHRL